MNTYPSEYAALIARLQRLRTREDLAARARCLPTSELIRQLECGDQSPPPITEEEVDAYVAEARRRLTHAGL